MHDDSQIDAYIRYFRRTSIPGARTWICYTRSLQRFEMAIGCPLHLQQLMGHATIASTMIYTHVAPEQFRAAQARIAA